MSAKDRLDLDLVLRTELGIELTEIRVLGLPQQVLETVDDDIVLLIVVNAYLVRMRRFMSKPSRFGDGPSSAKIDSP
jgi:adenylate kinase